MINSKSVFIIGAGSSKQYGYPVWRELKQEIINYLDLPNHNGNPHAEEAKHWLDDVTDAKTLDQVISERNKEIRAKYDPSQTEAMIWTAIATHFFDLERKVIDENRTGWIDLYSENIVASVIKSYQNDDEDWHLKLLTAAAQQLDKIYYVTFNYDRLLEYKINSHISERLRSDINNENEYGFKIRKSLNAIFKSKFFHPHGIINRYDGLDDNAKIEKNRQSGNIVYFGTSGNDAEHVLKYSPGMMASCFDCQENTGSLSDLHKTDIAPEDIYILGNSLYGLSNNIKKLPCKKWSESVNRIVCTSFNEQEQGAYKNIITSNFQKDIDITFYKTCMEFAETEANQL